MHRFPPWTRGPVRIVWVTLPCTQPPAPGPNRNETLCPHPVSSGCASCWISSSQANGIASLRITIRLRQWQPDVVVRTLPPKSSSWDDRVSLLKRSRVTRLTPWKQGCAMLLLEGQLMIVHVKIYCDLQRVIMNGANILMRATYTQSPILSRRWHWVQGGIFLQFDKFDTLYFHVKKNECLCCILQIRHKIQLNVKQKQ